MLVPLLLMRPSRVSAFLILLDTQAPTILMCALRCIVALLPIVLVGWRIWAEEQLHEEGAAQALDELCHLIQSLPNPKDILLSSFPKSISELIHNPIKKIMFFRKGSQEGKRGGLRLKRRNLS